MPRIQGVDWAAVADEVRDGRLRLDCDQRIVLCRKAAELATLLEAAGCAHRDISSGNTFINTTTWDVAFIDFDSVFHASLKMPKATTCGSEGYTPPFVWKNGRPRPEVTWCAQADRFALALICSEFLTIDKGSPVGAEGGMFDQEHLHHRAGVTVRHVAARLRDSYPDALTLFETALRSQRCADCPSPESWLAFCDARIGPTVTPPALDDLEAVLLEDFMQILQRRRPAAPVWPAPSLDQLPIEPLGVPQPVVRLPEDPWTHGVADVVFRTWENPRCR